MDWALRMDVVCTFSEEALATVGETVLAAILRCCIGEDGSCKDKECWISHDDIFRYEC